MKRLQIVRPGLCRKGSDLHLRWRPQVGQGVESNCGHSVLTGCPGPFSTFPLKALKGGREECCEMMVRTEELTVAALGRPPSLSLGNDFMVSDLPRPKNKSHRSQRGKGVRGKNARIQFTCKYGMRELKSTRDTCDTLSVLCQLPGVPSVKPKYLWNGRG